MVCPGLDQYLWDGAAFHLETVDLETRLLEAVMELELGSILVILESSPSVHLS